MLYSGLLPKAQRVTPHGGLDFLKSALAEKRVELLCSGVAFIRPGLSRITNFRLEIAELLNIDWISK